LDDAGTPNGSTILANGHSAERTGEASLARFRPIAIDDVEVSAEPAYNGELGTRRASGRAKTLNRLEQLAAQDENKSAAVKACQVLEQLEEHAVARPPTQLSPGFVIIVQGAAPSQRGAPSRLVIDANPIERYED
jgi:hypothetical protein